MVDHIVVVGGVDDGLVRYWGRRKLLGMLEDLDVLLWRGKPIKRGVSFHCPVEVDVWVEVIVEGLSGARRVGLGGVRMRMWG